MAFSVIRAAAVAALGMPLLTGCYITQDAATLTQGDSGNGASVAVAGMQIKNATLVAGDPDSGKAALLATVYNPTEEPDELTAVSADGAPATLLPEPIPVPPMSAVAVRTGSDAQADFTDLDAETGTYVSVSLVFTSAAQADFGALLVPPTGFYFDAAPEGTKEIVEEEAAAGEEAAGEEAAGEEAAGEEAAGEEAAGEQPGGEEESVGGEGPAPAAE